MIWLWKLLGILPSRWFYRGESEASTGCRHVAVVPYNRSLWIGDRVFDLSKTVVWAAQHPWGHLTVISRGSDSYKFKEPTDYVI